jgi:hypothetical protein
MSKIVATPHIRKEVLDHHVDFRTRGVLDEKYDLDWLKGLKTDPCKTGYWKYDPTTDRHTIRISPLAYNELSTDKTKRIQVPQLFRHVYEHEAAHSKFTTKDLKGLADKLSAEKIPWRLQNLFEDCRIERLWFYGYRRGVAGSGKWKWLYWDKRPESKDVDKISAQHLLYRIKCESLLGRPSRDFSILMSPLPFYRKVWAYYCRIVRARTTEDLIPILKDWLREFPHSGDDTIESEGGLGTGDLAGALKEGTGKAPSDVKAKDPKGEGASPEGKGDGDSSSPGGAGEEAGKAIDGTTDGYGTECNSDPFSGETPPKNPEELKEFKLSHRLAGMLDTAFRVKGDGKEITSNPSKRLNVRGILRGDFLHPYIGKSQSERGKPHVSLLVDCSGSMAHEAYVDRERKVDIRCDGAGRVLLRALNLLAKRGRITGVAYATARGGVRERVVLPIKDPRIFQKFHAWSDSEGIANALEQTPSKRSAFNEIVSKSKICLVYTDGCITDEPLDRKPLRARGLYTVGICCSHNETTRELKCHFDAAIWRESLWGMADALVRQLKSMPAR